MNITHSERLSYQLISAADADFLFRVDQDPHVMRFLNGGKKSSREHIQQVFVPRVQSFTKPELGWGLWKVTELATSQDIGWVLVRPMGFFTGNTDQNDIELGWRFMRSAWGQGYASEAAKHIQAAIYTTNQNQFFSAIAVAKNLASIAVMKRLGMVYIKTYLHSDPLFEERVVLYQKPTQLTVS